MFSTLIFDWKHLFLCQDGYNNLNTIQRNISRSYKPFGNLSNFLKLAAFSLSSSDSSSMLRMAMISWNDL